MLSVTLPSVTILSVTMLSVTMLSVTLQSVIILSVVAPKKLQTAKLNCFCWRYKFGLNRLKISEARTIENKQEKRC